MANGCNFLPPLGRRDENCCNNHDKHYKLKDVSRREADRELLECLLSRGTFFVLAYAMYAMVRIFGWIYWKRRR